MKKYLAVDTQRGYPTGSDMFYECQLCGISIPSFPKDSIGCKCRNIFIDVDYGRVSVKDDKSFRVYQQKGKI